MHRTLRNNPSAGLLSQGFQTRVRRRVAVERDPWADDRGRQDRHVVAGRRRLLELPAEARPESCCLRTSRSSLEEVGAGSGIAGAVSETSPIFWGKLERRGHRERP